MAASDAPQQSAKPSIWDRKQHTLKKITAEMPKIPKISLSLQH